MSFEWLDPADPRPEMDAALRAWLDLQQALSLRPQEAVQALERGGGPRAALRLAAAARARLARPHAAIATLRRLGVLGLPWLSPAYPERIRALRDAPPLLLLRGDRSLLARPAVAVVGARAASVYGRTVAQRFARELARAGLVIVSGLATGIDAVAHRAALEVGGATLAIQACGPDRVYPARHRELAEEIARHGALLTEFPLGTTPRPAYFPLRNRLISALSAAVLVVEARARSGSLSTASHAAAQGVDVWAVPGPLTSPTSAGANRLLADGAFVALSPERMLESLRSFGDLPRVARARRERAGGGGPAVDDPAGIVEALLHEPSTRDGLARRLARSPAELALALLELELAGRIAEDRDGRLRVVGFD